MEAPYLWKDIVQQINNGPATNILAADSSENQSQLFSSQVFGPVALFNMTQLLFVVASNNAMSGFSKLPAPTTSEAVAVDSISKMILQFSRESEKDFTGLGLNRVRTVNEDRRGAESKSVGLSVKDGNISIDPELLVVSLKLCLKLFDGSSVGPSELSRAKIADPGLASPKRTIFSNDYESEPPSPTYETGPLLASNSSSSINPTTRQPVLVLPEKPKPCGSPTSYTTRICLALSRSLITVYAVSLDKTGESHRRVASLRQEAQRWCGAEASAGLENAAMASGGSSAFQGDQKRDNGNGGNGALSSLSTAASFLESSSTVLKRNNTEPKKRQSMVVKGSALEGLLVSALSGTGEVHGNLAMEVGSVAFEVETLAEMGWRLEELVEQRSSGRDTPDAANRTLTPRQELVNRLVKLTSRR
ncbi:UNVERIFIED_CONTAM: hypothetical protein HDU68_004405, partial [Siphonaria sp. JEL0065]